MLLSCDSRLSLCLSLDKPRKSSVDLIVVLLCFRTDQRQLFGLVRVWSWSWSVFAPTMSRLLSPPTPYLRTAGCLSVHCTVL